MTALHEKAMLVNLNVSCWGATKKDSKASAEVCDQHGTDRGQAKVVKDLLPKGALDKVVAAAGRIRREHRRLTLPWTVEGYGLLPSAMFDMYTDNMRALRIQFDAEVEELERNYPNYLAAAELKLNGMFNRADYPSRVSDKFNVAIHFCPVPQASDFRVQMLDQDAAAIKEGIEESVRSALSESVNDLRDRIVEVIGHMAERLRAYNVEETIVHKNGRKVTQTKTTGKFHDTLVENVRDLLAILPALNVTGDARIAGVIEDTKKLLVDPQVLRDNDAVRVKTADTAEAILKKMAF